MAVALSIPLLLAVVESGNELPRWTAIVPTPGGSPSANLPTPANVMHTTVYYADNETWGGYVRSTPP